MSRIGTKFRARWLAFLDGVFDNGKRISDHGAAYVMLTGLGIAGWVTGKGGAEQLLRAFGMWIGTFLLVTLILVIGGKGRDAN